MYVTKEIQNMLEKRKRDVHQRSIFRQMMNTCQKFENSFLTPQQCRQFSAKQKLQKLTFAQSTQHSRQRIYRKTHCPTRGSTQPSSPIVEPQLVYVKQSKQVKQIKLLRQKMIPKVSKTILQKKFKQISYIRNQGYKTRNRKLQSFKTLTIQKDQDRTINRSWNHFYKDSKFLTPTQTPNLYPHYQLFPVEQTTVELQRKRHTKRKTNKKASYYISVRSSPLKCKKSVEESLNTTVATPLDTTVAMPGQTMLEASGCEEGQGNVHQTSVCQVLGVSMDGGRVDELPLIDFCKKDDPITQTPPSTRTKTLLKQTLSNLHLSRSHSKPPPSTTHPQPLLSHDRKKQITQKIGLTRQKLMKQNAFSLYKLVKGGYDVDSNDPQGGEISLRRFRQARGNFLMLNTCFKKIKQQRYMFDKPQSVFNDSSFRSLVYLSQTQNKIAPALFKRIQLLNGVVD